MFTQKDVGKEVSVILLNGNKHKGVIRKQDGDYWILDESDKDGPEIWLSPKEISTVSRVGEFGGD